MSYFEVDYASIQAVPFDVGALSRRDEFGSLITEFADDAVAAAYLAQHLAAGAVFNDWECIGSTGVCYLYDLRQKNALRTQLQGFDASVLYRFDVSQNAFDLQLNLTHLNEILTSLAAGTATFDLVDTYNLPLDWRFRARGTWSRGGLSSTLVVNHADNYINDTNAIDVPVGSWTTADLNVSYNFDGRTQSSLLAGKGPRPHSQNRVFP